ncbi:ATP phosphoribosyltransferase regulatory subunit [Candidatus Microgenomates bacterium]|nr:ATP phosphoribosyltransferase regulatory subunit [Candidatus Microgenomates bacterium]
MTKAPPTPKGFRDITPILAQKRREVINKIIAVLEEFKFVPIETPIVEFAETLKGKYGEEEKLIYEFKDRGGRDLALRYDLTVPLARYVATHHPTLPFRRYQVGEVFRGENPQKGRWRQFTQLDADIVGSTDLTEDAKVIAAALKAVKSVGLTDIVMTINDRQNFEGLSKETVIALDKLDKIGDEGVIREMVEKNIKDAKLVLENIKNTKPTADLEKIFSNLTDLGVAKDEFQFVPTLARGLDYYTGAIFELRTPQYGNLSLGAGGRYDNLIGMFLPAGADKPAQAGAKNSLPAVGFSFGIDRLVDCLSNE